MRTAMYGVIAAGLVATVVGCSRSGAPTTEATERTGGSGPPITTSLFWGLEATGERVEPLGPIEGPAPAAFHYEVERQPGGQVSRWRWLSPNGTARETVEVEHGGAAARKLTFVDGYGALDNEKTQTSAGDTTTRWRSGTRTDMGCSTRKKRFDTEGRVARVTCVDPDGRIVINTRGCAIDDHEWSAEGHLLSRSCRDEAGRPTSDRWGVHTTWWRRDARGWTTATGSLDVTGRFVVHARDGCGDVRYDLDDAGNRIGARCVDGDGLSVEYEGRTHAGSRSVYDGAGCEVLRTFVDRAGEPHSDGRIAQMRWRRDGLCGVLGYAQLDVNGRPAGNDGYTAWSYDQVLDDEGLVSRKSCRGENDRPVTCLFAETPDDGDIGSVYTFEYDDRGRQRCRRAWTLIGQPARLSYSYPHATCTSYGRDGRRTVQEFHGADGKPAPALGVTRMEYEHDVLGYQVHEFYTDNQGERMRSAVGCAGFRDEYDHRQRYLGRRCEGIDGRPMASLSGLHQAGVSWPEGTARVVVVRDGDHRVVANEFLGVDGSLIEQRSCSDQAVNCYRW